MTQNHTSHSLSPVLRDRWSPVGFLPEPIRADALHAMLEAARWAPSCYNAQPWRFIVAARETPAFTAVLAALVDANQVWAAHAGALVALAAQDLFSHNGKPNRWACYDAGAAALSFCIQATAEGYATHQMGGFSPEALAAAVQLPPDHTLLSVIAVGKPAPAATLSDALRTRQSQPRERIPTIAYGGTFGTALRMHDDV